MSARLQMHIADARAEQLRKRAQHARLKARTFVGFKERLVQYRLIRNLEKLADEEQHRR